MILAKSLWHLSEKQSSIQTQELDVSKDGLVQIKSLFSLISTGTERLVAQGQVPSSLHQSMTVPYMQGDFSFPVQYGYSLVAKVMSKGHALEGKIVHLLHPHQDICYVRSEDVAVVPEGISAKRAVLTSNVETALNAIWDAKVSIGDRVVVVGFGIIGSLLARLLQLMPVVEVLVVEKNEERLALAQKMGFTVTAKQNEKFDCAFHASSTAGGLQYCIDHVGLEGKVIELSWYGNKDISIRLGESFHQERKQIISSQVGKLPADYQSRWDYKRRKEVVFKLLQNPIFDEHLTHTIPFDESPTFFDALRRNEIKGLSHTIAY